MKADPPHTRPHHEAGRSEESEWSATRAVDPARDFQIVGPVSRGTEGERSETEGGAERARLIPRATFK